MSGHTSKRESSYDLSFGGYSVPVSLDCKQDFFGIQMGVEGGAGPSGGEGVSYGLTAGYVSSNLGFSDKKSGAARYDAFNIGAYVSWKRAGAFANALAKYDFINADAVNLTAGFTSSSRNAAYGVRGELGYRLETGRAFFEPVVSLDYQRTDIDDFSAYGAMFQSDGFDGLRGTAGMKLGGIAPVGSSTMTYYLAGKAVREFEGRDPVKFTLGTTTVPIANDRIDTYGRFELGVNLVSKGGVTGFIEANADYGKDYRSAGGRVGIRVDF